MRLVGLGFRNFWYALLVVEYNDKHGKMSREREEGKALASFITGCFIWPKFSIGASV